VRHHSRNRAPATATLIHPALYTPERFMNAGGKAVGVSNGAARFFLLHAPDRKKNKSNPGR
jgi:hypothetical protein